MSIDAFYKLTPRQFHNIQTGYYRKKEEALKEQLLFFRGVKFAVLLPHLKDKNATEEKVFPLYWEKTTSVKVNLEEEAQRVSEQKESIWARIDAMKKGEA